MISKHPMIPLPPAMPLAGAKVFKSQAFEGHGRFKLQQWLYTPVEQEVFLRPGEILTSRCFIIPSINIRILLQTEMVTETTISREMAHSQGILPPAWIDVFFQHEQIKSI